MGIFSVKCPQCGVMLEADEKYIGARAACAECDFHFILQKIDEEVVPVIELHPTKSAGSEIREEQKKQAQPSTEFKEFSFVNPPSKLTFAKPVALIVPSGIIEVNSWNDILCACFNYALTHENAAVLRTFLDKENNLFSKRMILSSSAANLRRARELSENVFLETNLSASHIIQIVCGLMKNCGFPAEQFFIRYIPRGTNVSDLKNEEYSIDNQPETEVSKPTTEKIVATSPIEVFQFYPNVLQALKNQNVSLVKDLLVVPGSRFSCERNIGSSKVKAMRALVNALRPYLQGSDTESIPLEALPIAPTLSPLGKKNWEEMCSADQKFVDTEKIDKSDTSTTAVFQKRIDWSLLTAGTAIPVAYYDLFLKNLSYEPQPGEGQAVDVVLEDKRYSARVIKIAFSSGRKPVLQLLWGSKNSGIVKVLQATFAQIYAQLSADRKNTEGLDHIFTFSQGKQLDEFILSLDKPLIEVSETDKQVPETRITSIQTVDIEELKALICRDFSNGFVFNAGTIKLLENKLGRDCSETEQRELKRIMFKRSDDVYLLPEMVADDETVADMTARIREYFAEYGCFSLSVLFDEFGYVLKNLTNPDSDFRLFLLKTILPDDGKIFGRLQRQICIPGNISEEEVTQTLAERIREMLQGYGDAVCIDDLDNELPYLNKPALEMILQEHIADAIEIKVDGLSYWKLVEFFCLPDDFAEYLQFTVSSMEEAQTAPSLQTLSEAMEQQYGEGFREIYAVDDDDVFKQIIKVCIADDQYSWNRNVFAKQNAGQELNVADEFLQTQQGIFHESEFFDYASTHRGLTNRTTLICGYLRPRCIRLDQFHWISLENFDTQSDYSNEIADKISEILNGMLGARTFLPIGTLPEALLSSLPVISINGRTFYWNHYMLASIAAHKTNKLRIVNDEPSPYTVTAMLIPLAAQYNDDIVDYIFNDMRHSGNILGTADEVFEFLKSHQIRMTKTQKLMERIKDFWSFE